MLTSGDASALMVNPKRTAVVSFNVTLSDDCATTFQSFCVGAPGINGDPRRRVGAVPEDPSTHEAVPVDGDDDQSNLPEGFHWTLTSLVEFPGRSTAVPSMCPASSAPCSSASPRRGPNLS